MRMRIQGVRIGLLLVLVTLLVPVLSRAGVPELIVSVENTSPIELGPQTTLVPVLIKVSGDGAPDPSSQPTVEAVLFGATPLRSAKFTAGWATKPPSTRIDVQLDRSEMNRAGTYDVYLAVPLTTGADASKHVVSVRLKCQLLVVAPKLAPVAKLVVNRTRYLLGWHDELPTLTLREVTGQSDLTVTGITQLGQPTVANETTSGELTFTPPLTVSAGQSTPVCYGLAGDFPLGNASVSAEVNAKELREPAATVQYEIRSRWHPLWIEVPVIAGLILSYFIKVFLQRRIDLSAARVGAVTLRDRVRSEEPKHRDTTFRDAYHEELDALDRALKRSDPAAINVAKGNLDDRWRAALQALVTRRQAEQDELTKLRDVTDYDWSVPTDVQRAVLLARTAEADVVSAIAVDDLDAAKQTLKQVTITLGERVRDAGVQWQDQTKRVLQVLLTPAPGGLSKATSPAYAPAGQAAIAALNRITPGDALDSPPKIQEALNAVRGEMSVVRQVMGNLCGTLDWELNAAKRLLANPPGDWNASGLDNIVAATARLQETLRSSAVSPTPESVEDALSAVHAAWVDAVGHRPDTRIGLAIKENDYLGALAIAIEAKTTPTTVRKLDVEDRDEVANLAGPRPYWTFAAPAFIAPTPNGVIPTHAVRTILQTDSVPGPLPLTEAAATGELLKQKAILTGLLAVVVGIGAYGLQSGTFLGTWTELTTLFFWAFGLDLTVDAVSKLRK